MIFQYVFPLFFFTVSATPGENMFVRDPSFRSDTGHALSTDQLTAPNPVNVEACNKLFTAIQTEKKQYWGSAAMTFLIGLDFSPIVTDDMAHTMATAIWAAFAISLFVMVPVVSFTLIHILYYFPYYEPRCPN